MPQSPKSKKHDTLCAHCGTPSSKSPRGKEMNAVQESQAAQQQIRAERELEMRRRSMQPASPMMPMARQMPPQMQRPQMPGMRPPMASPAAGGVPVRPGPDPRAALLRAILAQAQRGQR